jgi:8-oxo-dGTP pyrophosphatase MutT (NUDIX family)
LRLRGYKGYFVDDGQPQHANDHPITGNDGVLRFEIVRERLVRNAERDLSARERLMPRDAQGRSTRPVDAPEGIIPRVGAVLVLLYPHRGDLHIPLTVRTASLRHHSGEVSLPGGGFDAADETLDRTALREASEELGIVSSDVEIVTSLTPVWIPVSHFRITPYVGIAAQRPRFTPAPAEVAMVIEAPLATLTDPRNIQSEVRELRGGMVQVPYFAVGDHHVWGATALVLAQLVGRLAEAGSVFSP